MGCGGAGHARGLSGGVAFCLLASLLVALPAAPAQAGGVVRAAGPTGYFDVCDDADGDPLDLRRMEIDQPGTNLRFTASACAPWADDALDTRSVRWELSMPGASPFADVTIARSGGALEVTATQGGAVTHTGPAVRTGASGIRADVPLDALAAPESFQLVLRVQGSTGPVDTLPDITRGEPRLSYPDPCRDSPVVVSTAVDGYGAAVEAARTAGLGVGTQVPEVGAFSVDATPAAARAALAGQRGAVTIDRPAPVRRLAVTPDDPHFPEQWALGEINAPRAWGIRTGSERRVAIVDDGVDATRTDLVGRVGEGHDVRFDRVLPANQSSDRGGHGTAAASLVAARGDNAVDLAGLDWSATIVPYRIFDAAGCSDPVDVAAAIVRAADAGVAVINLSVGTVEDTPALRNAVAYAHQQGVVQVAAAGNTRETGNAPLYPAAYPEVIGVGATYRAARLAPYSSTGPQVHLVAPGGAGTGRAADDLLALGERGVLTPRAGTSFAAPLVAGAVLLYQGVDPAGGPDVVASALARTATDLGQPGRDDLHGHGFLDVHRLLVQAGINRSCPPGGVPAAPFTDVPAGTVHAPSIDCVVWWSVAQGVTPAEYRPAAHVTRAQMATFIARTVERAGANLPVTRDHFPDDDGNHHERAINQLAEAEIVAGRAGRYSPNDPVTRAQMASFLARAHTLVTGEEQPAPPPPFDDIAGNVHEDAISAAFEAGLVRGRTATLYGPRSAVRRDQMGSFLTNLIGAFVRDGHLAPHGG